MVVFPNAKVNIGLSVTERRADGFHNIETVFYPIPLQDILEVVPSQDEEDHFEFSGLPIPGKPSENLLVKALDLLRSCCKVPRVSVYLHKVIPMGGGLGGGSSNAAFFLDLLNNLFELKLSNQKLLELALTLGSDCPFFLLNKPAFGSGRGEFLTPIPLDLKGKFMVLQVSDIHVSTKLAFSKVTPSPAGIDLRNLNALGLGSWQEKVVNDFEKSVFHQFPMLSSAKDNLMAQGAIYASMSGTGATVYGVFNEKPTLKQGVILEL